MRRTSLLIVACVACSANASIVKRVQTPAPAPDGKSFVFSWQGDLWRVGINGGRAERLTVHPASEINPRFTPDGKKIVFSSNRYGNYDVFIMNADGSGLKRLNYESGQEYVNSVSPDGKYVYGYTNYFGRTDLFRVNIEGGDIIPISDHIFEAEFSPTISSDGKRVYYNRGSYGASVWRKPGVTGTAVGDIWVADNTVPLSNHRNLTNSDASELMPLPQKDGTMIYSSNKSGWPNLYKGNTQLTNHTDGTLRNPQATPDGSIVLYEFNSEIWKLDVATKKTVKLEIDVPDDQRNHPEVELTLNSGVQDYAFSPDGKRGCIQVRGELFLIPGNGGTTRRLTTNVAMDQHPTWIDNKTILYAEAELAGKRSLKTVDIDGNIKPFLTDSVDLMHPVVSPDGKWVAFHRGITEICVVPATGGAKTTTIRGNFVDVLDGEAQFNWSPDSKFLVYAKPTDRGATVQVAAIDGSKDVTVAWLARGGSVPQFMPNGKAVYFTAYERTEPELFVVDLVPKDLTFSEDDLDNIDKPRPKQDQVKVEIYEPWIERRMQRLTNGATGTPQHSPDGRGIYANVGGKFSLVSLTGNVSPAEQFTGNPSRMSVANGKMYFTSAGRLFSYTPGTPAPAPVNFSANMTVNLRDEETALFNEVGWALENMYYDPGMHGKNWKAIRDKFAKVVPYVTDRSDFYALIGEMMEELDSSHLGSTAPPSESYGSDSTAYLGVNFDPKEQAAGRMVVASITTASPASLPQSKLEVGDRLISVDKVKISATEPLAKLLNKKAGKKVVLGVVRGGREIEVTIKPEPPTSRTSRNYEDWVAWQRKETERLSNGQLTYFHIAGMSDPEYIKFLRDIRVYTIGKKGAIIDVRYNGGGSTSHKVLGILIKTPWLIRTTRGPEGIKLSENIYRGDSLELPTALMMNSYSFSNAEIMGEGFRMLNRGPIIGERTPGYVIGTGAFSLWDGGSIRMPSIGAYAVNGENLENNGRKPDFNVPFDPNAWSSGRDPQLEKAVQELLKRLKG